MKRLMYLLAFLGLSGAAQADEHYGNFFTTQPALEYAYIGATMADLSTTLDIKNHHTADGTWTLEEKNPLLGKHPSDAYILGFGAAAIALHMAVTYEMVSNDVPRPVIQAWELVSFGVELGFAGNNYRMGLRCKF